MLDRALYQYMFYLAAKEHCGNQAAGIFKQRFKSLIIPKRLVDIDTNESTGKGRGAKNMAKLDQSVQNGIASLDSDQARGPSP